METEYYVITKDGIIQNEKPYNLSEFIEQLTNSEKQAFCLQVFLVVDE